MTFETLVCTEAMFDELRLPAILRSNADYDPIGKEMIVDRAACAVLIPRPYCHGDYPDRTLNLYVRGSHFSVWQQSASTRKKGELSLSFEADASDAECEQIARLLEAAMARIDNDPNLPLPVVCYKRAKRG